MFPAQAAPFPDLQRRIDTTKATITKLEQLAAEFDSTRRMLDSARANFSVVLSYDYGRLAVTLPTTTLIPVLEARLEELRTAIEEELS